MEAKRLVPTVIFNPERINPTLGICPACRQLNDELLKEAEGLVAQRGFITTYTDKKELSDNQVRNLAVTTNPMNKAVCTAMRFCLAW